jgi:tetratricopeptide (TPR) repeat protein
MARRLVGLFNIRHPREGFGWFQQVVAIAGDLPVRSRARLLGDTAYAAMNAGDLQAQVRYATAALDVGGEDAPAVVHQLLGQWQMYVGNYAQAVEHLQRASAIAAATDDLTAQASVSAMLVQALAWLGDEPGARRLIADAIELAERLGNPTITAACHLVIASALAFVGSRREAIAMLDTALPHADDVGPNVAGQMWVLWALLVDDPAEAARALRAAVRLAKDQLAGLYQLEPLVAAAKVAAQSGRDRLAARLLGTYDQQGDAMGRLHWVTGPFWREQLVEQLTQKLGSSAVNEELRQGAQLTPAQALQLVAELVGMTS